MELINMQENINIEQLKDKGFLTIKNFLDKKEVEKIVNRLKEVPLENIGHGDQRGYFPVTAKAKLAKFLKLDFKSLITSSMLIKMAEKLELKKIAENFFKSDVNLHMIDSYYSPVSKEPCIDWHSDMTFKPGINYNINIASLKFFFYLTDVQSKNGCLAYVPYSNVITKAVAELIVSKKIKYSPYWDLQKLRDLVLSKDNLNQILNVTGEEKFEKFIENTKFIENKDKDTEKFDLEMGRGGVVIFDEFGVHRGSMPSKTSRQVLRIFYRKK